MALQEGAGVMSPGRVGMLGRACWQLLSPATSLQAPLPRPSWQPSGQLLAALAACSLSSTTQVRSQLTFSKLQQPCSSCIVVATCTLMHGMLISYPPAAAAFGQLQVRAPQINAAVMFSHYDHDSCKVLGIVCLKLQLLTSSPQRKGVCKSKPAV